jgi:hypothetical protein
MEEGILKYILPEGMLEYFIITKVEEIIDKVSKAKVLCIELEEKNELPAGYNASDYESKGFYPGKQIHDFPIRDRAVSLVIKRRRWRHKVNKNEVINNDYPLFAEGSKFTQEFSDFLKDAD